MVKHSGGLGIRRNGPRSRGTAREIAARTAAAAVVSAIPTTKVIALHNQLAEAIAANVRAYPVHPTRPALGAADVAMAIVRAHLAHVVPAEPNDDDAGAFWESGFNAARAAMLKALGDE